MTKVFVEQSLASPGSANYSSLNSGSGRLGSGDMVYKPSAHGQRGVWEENVKCWLMPDRITTPCIHYCTHYCIHCYIHYCIHYCIHYSPLLLAVTRSQLWHSSTGLPGSGVALVSISDQHLLSLHNFFTVYKYYLPYGADWLGLLNRRRQKLQRALGFGKDFYLPFW